MTQSQPDGYLAVPAAGSGRSVLVLHAWWGLNDTIRGLCDRLAAEGFVAFAPDLYHGRVTDTIEGAETLSGTLDAAGAASDVAAAVRYLSEHDDPVVHDPVDHDPDGRGLAVVAFSLGVWFAMEASTAFPEQISKVVIFYGSAPGDYSASQASYLGHFAADDPYEPREYVDETEANLRDAGRAVTFHHYPGTGHWFFEPDRIEAYDAAAAGLAWERTLAFLRGS